MKPFVLLCFVLLACMFMVPTGGAVLANISDCQQGAEITVMVGGLKDAEVSANIFKWQDGLRVDWSRTQDTTKYEVLSYDYARAQQNSALIIFRDIIGPKFSEVLQDIAKAKAGDVIYIDDILVKTSAGKVLKMPALIHKLI